MLKISFTKKELETLLDEMHFTTMQERIIKYRLDEYSITKMAMLENCSESTISREISKIKKKIKKGLDVSGV